jgi:hypothetical protein
MSPQQFARDFLFGKINMTQKEEYLQMGFKLLPSGRIDHHLWYGRKFGLSSMKDSTWVSKAVKKVGKYNTYPGYHKCCKSQRSYCHKIGCKNRKDLLDDSDDYSDLKEI